MDPLAILIYVASEIVSLVILYFVIKAAVRNGYIEAKRDILAVKKRAAAARAAQAEVARSPPPSGEIW